MTTLRFSAVLALAIPLITAAAEQKSRKVSFEREIQPLFQKHCVECHGSSQQMSGLRLDQRSSAMKVQGGTRIGPGNAIGSRLYLKLLGKATGALMPPAGSLSADQITLVRDWIDQGAEWPDALSGDQPPTRPDALAVKWITALRAGQRPRALDRQSVNLRGHGGSTPLMQAVLYGEAETMEKLLDAGADPNLANDAGATALMWAMSEEQTDKAQLLLERGAKPNVQSMDEHTPFSIAMRSRNALPLAAMLFASGLKLDAKAAANRRLMSPAVRNQALKKLLLEHGVKEETLAASVPDPKEEARRVTPGLGFTALMTAAGPALASLQRVKELIANGSDVNHKSSYRMTALDYALRQGRPEIIEELRKTGAVEGDAPVVQVPNPQPAPSVKAAIERALPLLQKADVQFFAKSGCVSCHNNSLTAAVVAEARRKRVAFDVQTARSQVSLVGKYVGTQSERALQGQPIPGAADTVGYILFGLDAENYPADWGTDAMARVLKMGQREDGSWRSGGPRPPIESSDIETTAVAMKSLQTYAIPARRPEYDAAVRKAAKWLTKAKAESTEDHTFLVLGLVWSKAEPALIRAAVDRLLATQRTDGGWCQIETLGSDAYATGEALVALQTAGVLDRSSPALARGVKYLRESQLADGSWYVRSRAMGFQPHFESGFPHGADQFVSAAASNWATLALIGSLR